MVTYFGAYLFTLISWELNEILSLPQRKNFALQSSFKISEESQSIISQNSTLWCLLAIAIQIQMSNIIRYRLQLQNGLNEPCWMF